MLCYSNCLSMLYDLVPCSTYVSINFLERVECTTEDELWCAKELEFGFGHHIYKDQRLYKIGTISYLY